MISIRIDCFLGRIFFITYGQNNCNMIFLYYYIFVNCLRQRCQTNDPRAIYSPVPTPEEFIEILVKNQQYFFLF